MGDAPAILAHPGGRDALQYHRLRRCVGLLDGLHRVSPLPLSGYGLCHTVRVRLRHRHGQPGGVWLRAGSPQSGESYHEPSGLRLGVRYARGRGTLGTAEYTVAPQAARKRPDGWRSPLTEHMRSDSHRPMSTALGDQKPAASLLSYTRRTRVVKGPRTRCLLTSAHRV